MSFSLVAAVSKNGIIGDGNKIPWNIPGELARFKKLTMGGTLIMGRKTFDSIGRPLPGRKTIVLTRDVNLKIPGCDIINSIEEVLPLELHKKEVFIVGGAEIYEQFMEHSNKIYLSVIQKDFEGDTVFPAIPSFFHEVSSVEVEASIPYIVKILEK